MEQTVAIVEDNENARDALAAYLRLEGHRALECPTLAAARNALANEAVDLIVLDVMLPDGDGFLFAKQIRARRDTPILFLTARDGESDRITGLELGAEDYVVKPFSPKEVVLRVNNILKRSAAARRVSTGGAAAAKSGAMQTREAHATVPPAERFALSGSVLVFDHATRRLTLDDVRLDVTVAEWSILHHLAHNAPRVYERVQLLDACLGSISEGSERTIDTHIKNLRRKLGSESWIETARGIGYRFGGTPA